MDITPERLAYISERTYVQGLEVLSHHIESSIADLAQNASDTHSLHLYEASIEVLETIELAVIRNSNPLSLVSDIQTTVEAGQGLFMSMDRYGVVAIFCTYDIEEISLVVAVQYYICWTHNYALFHFRGILLFQFLKL